MESQYGSHWDTLERSDNAVVKLVKSLEGYTKILAKNMGQLFTQPFDAVSDNIGMIIWFSFINLSLWVIVVTIFIPTFIHNK